MRKLTTWLGVCGLAGAMTLLGGCASNPNGPITSESFRSNPSPELYSTAQAYQQFKNSQAEVINLDTRQIPDDISAILLLDRPVYFSPYSMP